MRNLIGTIVTPPWWSLHSLNARVHICVHSIVSYRGLVMTWHHTCRPKDEKPEWRHSSSLITCPELNTRLQAEPLTARTLSLRLSQRLSVSSPRPALIMQPARHETAPLWVSAASSRLCHNITSKSKLISSSSSSLSLHATCRSSSRHLRHCWIKFLSVSIHNKWSLDRSRMFPTSGPDADNEPTRWLVGDELVSPAVSTGRVVVAQCDRDGY